KLSSIKRTPSPMLLLTALKPAIECTTHRAPRKGDPIVTEIQIDQLAAAATALLVPIFAKSAVSAIAKKAGEKAAEGAESTLKALYQAVKRKFTRDKDAFAVKALERFEEQPENKARQAALSD